MPGLLFLTISTCLLEQGTALFLRVYKGGHPILFLSREKVRENKIFKNNELKTGPLFRNTSPSDSVHGFVFDFDEFLTNNEL